MKFLIIFCLLAVMFNIARSVPILQNGPLTSNLGQNLVSPTGLAGTLNPGLANTLNPLNNINNMPAINTNLTPNNFAAGKTVLGNDINNNMLANANSAIVNQQMIGQTLPATITSANFIPISDIPGEMINNLPMTPVISEIVPSLQCGDVTMTGDLPISGTIKVCGCFPVYGMVNVDGSVPSTGTAVVAESFGNNLADTLSQCANQIVL